MPDKMLKFVKVNQQTPKRVSHRRADKIRKRRVIEVKDILIFDEAHPTEVEFSLTPIALSILIFFSKQK